jgi:hypothetical protein
MKIAPRLISAILLVASVFPPSAQQSTPSIPVNVASVADADNSDPSAFVPHANAGAAPAPNPKPTILPSTESEPDSQINPNDESGPRLARRPPLTTKFFLLWAPAIGFQVADAEFTVRCANTHLGCSEGNPLFGAHPSRERMYSIKMGYTAMAMFFSQKWWRDPHGYTDYSETLPIAFTMIGGVGTALDIANYPWGSPSARRAGTSPGHLSLEDRWIPPREVPTAWKEMYGHR